MRVQYLAIIMLVVMSLGVIFSGWVVVNEINRVKRAHIISMECVDTYTTIETGAVFLHKCEPRGE